MALTPSNFVALAKSEHRAMAAARRHGNEALARQARAFRDYHITYARALKRTA